MRIGLFGVRRNALGAGLLLPGLILGLSLLRPTPAQAELGKDWTHVSSFSSHYFQTCLVFKDKLWLIGGVGPSYDPAQANDVWSSEDGAVWTPLCNSTPFSGRIDYSSVVFKDKLWVIGGSYVRNEFGRYFREDYNDVWCSADGVEWTSTTLEAEFAPRGGHTSVVFDNKMWVIGGSNWLGLATNDVWWSEDGIHWNQSTANPDFGKRDGHTSVVFNNRMWVIGGEGLSEGAPFPMLSPQNDVWSSADGITWEQANASAAFPPRCLHSSVVYDNKIWVLAGQGQDATPQNDVWSSVDGQSWTSATLSAAFSPHENQSGVIYSDKMWVIGGEAYSAQNGAWSSSDGINWTDANPERYPGTAYGAAVLNNKIWAWDGDGVWCSEDGEHWNMKGKVPPFEGGYVPFLPFNNKLWFIDSASQFDIGAGGTKLWSSDDGTSWTQVTNSVPFSPRDGYACVVFDDKLWVIGGYNSFQALDDVWWSADGQVWNQAAASAGFATALNTHAVVWRDRIWVTAQSGGLSDGSVIWSSQNGTDWTQATFNKNLFNYYDFDLLVYADKLWWMAGWNHDVASVYYSPEIWWSGDGSNWQTATTQAPFTAGHGVEFKDKLWFLGDSAWYSQMPPNRASSWAFYE